VWAGAWDGADGSETRAGGAGERTPPGVSELRPVPKARSESATGAQQERSRSAAGAQGWNEVSLKVTSGGDVVTLEGG